MPAETMDPTGQNVQATATDYRVYFRQYDEMLSNPEYSLSVPVNLNTLEDSFKSVTKMLEDRKKRDAEEARRRRKREERQQQRQQQEPDEDELLQAAEPQLEAGEAGKAPVGATHDPLEEDEPAAEACLNMAAHEVLPPIDLSPLGLADLAEDAASASQSATQQQDSKQQEQWLLLQPLLATGQLFSYLGVELGPGPGGQAGGEDAGPALRVLFELVSYGDQPLLPYQQAISHYKQAAALGVSPGWVPQLSDFLAALKALGYRALAHGAGGHAGHNTGAAATPAAASGRSAKKRGGSKGGAEPQAEGGPSGSGSAGQVDGSPGGGAAAGGAGGAGARLHNLQALLRLLAGLCELHGKGVDVGFGNASEAAGKELLVALLRMTVDPELVGRGGLYPDLRSALEAALAPWEGAVWARVAHDTARAVAELGPSHRAAWRAISRCHGVSQHVRYWQQCAAMELLRKLVPQSVAGAGAGGSSGRGRGGRRGGAGSGGGGGGVDAEEMMELLGGPQASQDAAAALVAALRQQQAGGQQQGGRARGRRSAGGAGGSGGGGGGRPDMWRLCSIVQAVHLIVWNAVGYTGELGEGELALVEWARTLLRQLEGCLKRGAQSSPAAMEVLVLLTRAATQYDTVHPMGS